MTKLLLRWAKDKRENLKESWAGGSFSAAFRTEMLVKNAGATGYCDAMSDILNIESVDLERVDE